jgi:hypothetical protein
MGGSSRLAEAAPQRLAICERMMAELRDGDRGWSAVTLGWR